jgi:hypothetical protein
MQAITEHATSEGIGCQNTGSSVEGARAGSCPTRAAMQDPPQFL